MSDDDASASVLPAATPALTTPLVSKPTAVASLEEITKFLSTTGLHFKSTDDYARWFTPAAKLILATPADPEAFMTLLLKGLEDTKSPKRIIAGLSNAYEQCQTPEAKAKLCLDLHGTIREKLGSLIAAKNAAAKSSATTSSPDFKSSTGKKLSREASIEAQIVTLFQTGLAQTRYEKYAALLGDKKLRNGNPKQWIQDMSEVLGVTKKPLNLASMPLPEQTLFAELLAKYIDNARRTSYEMRIASGVVPKHSQTSSDSEELSFRAGNRDSFKQSADRSNDSMSDNDDLASTADAMQDRLKKARGTLEDLEFSGAETPTQDPSDDTPVPPLTPQKTAQEESASQNSTPKPANGVAGTEPIDGDEWNKMVKLVSAHMEAQGYKVDLEFTGGTGGHTSFSRKTPPPEGTLSMTRDDQTKLRIVSNLKPAQPELLIRSFYETGQRHAVVKSSESADHTKGLLEASKKYDGMTLELAPAVLAEFKAKYPDLVNELSAKSKPAKRRP